MNVHGDIIPLAFKTDIDEDKYSSCQVVVFKVGRLMYMTSIFGESTPGNPVCLGALPLQFGDPFDLRLLDAFFEI